jgi:hypothetical protein
VLTAAILLVLILLGLRHLWSTGERPLDQDELRTLRRLDDRTRMEQGPPYDY